MTRLRPFRITLNLSDGTERTHVVNAPDAFAALQHLPALSDDARYHTVDIRVTEMIGKFRQSATTQHERGRA